MISIKHLSNDELRGKTNEFKQRIKEHLTEIDETIATKKSEAEQLPEEEIRSVILYIKKLMN